MSPFRITGDVALLVGMTPWLRNYTPLRISSIHPHQATRSTVHLKVCHESIGFDYFCGDEEAGYYVVAVTVGISTVLSSINPQTISNSYPYQNQRPSSLYQPLLYTLALIG
jgi:hypothetical protein